jgi:hypothetical protein
LLTADVIHALGATLPTLPTPRIEKHGLLTVDRSTRKTNLDDGWVALPTRTGLLTVARAPK